MFVHDVVILEQLLANLEVVRLHLLLGVLNRAGHHAMLDGHPFLHAKLQHEVGDSFGSEDPEEVIFQGEIEPRRTRVALTTGSAAQLVVNPPALVSLGADDV